MEASLGQGGGSLFSEPALTSLTVRSPTGRPIGRPTPRNKLNVDKGLVAVGSLSPVASTREPASPTSSARTWAADADFTPPKLAASLSASPRSESLSKWTDTARLESIRDELVIAHHNLDAYLVTEPKQWKELLLKQVAKLECDIRAVQDEAKQWKECYFNSQRSCAMAMDCFEEKAELELRDAETRELHLKARERELSLSCANAEEQAQRQRQVARTEAQRAEELKAQHAEQLREIERKHARTACNAEERAAQLEARIAKLTIEHSEKLLGAEREHAHTVCQLKQRISQLENSIAHVERDCIALHVEDIEKQLRQERTRRIDTLNAAEQRVNVLTARAASLTARNAVLEDELVKERAAGEASAASAALARRSEERAQELLATPIGTIAAESLRVAGTTALGRHELERLERTRQLREGLSARLGTGAGDKTASDGFGVCTAGEGHRRHTSYSSRRALSAARSQDYESKWKTHSARAERTTATDRYNNQGGLISYDAVGRAL